MMIQAYFVLYLMVEFASTQFISSRRQSKTPCEIRGTALVEQFFNVAFAEFQHSPPTCTCVQMCVDQPTYCYPNGCFKRSEKRKETPPVSSIQQDTKTVFLVDNNRDIITDLMGNVNLMGSSAAGNAEKTYLRPWESNFIGRNNPFKEIVFKYKRLPKLQMKYNLREQIKHTRDKKTEVDLSKTRWPTNKQINKQVSQQRTSNYLTSMFPEANHPETPKYFKRYLTKRENQIGVDISALYLYKDASNFSLETLIDNLIERGPEGANRTLRFELNNSTHLRDEEKDSDTTLINSIGESQKDFNKVARTNTLITNSTGNNNNNEQKDSNNTNSSTAAYFDMITTLSKKIEEQNNVSMEAMGRVISSKVKVSEDKSTNFSSTTELIKTDLEQTLTSTTDIVPTSLHFIPVIKSHVKKGKQRIARKLRNRKLN